MTTTTLPDWTMPDWEGIAESGASLGEVRRAELLGILSELKQLEGLSMRACATLIHFAGGPEAMADVDREVHSAATDARSAHRLAKAMRERIEQQLAGQA